MTGLRLADAIGLPLLALAGTAMVIVGGAPWTLVFAGRHRGTWRFWTPEGPVDWRAYEDAGD